MLNVSFDCIVVFIFGWFLLDCGFFFRFVFVVRFRIEFVICRSFFRLMGRWFWSFGLVGIE